jgi:hypothetical protein
MGHTWRREGVYSGHCIDFSLFGCVGRTSLAALVCSCQIVRGETATIVEVIFRSIINSIRYLRVTRVSICRYTLLELDKANNIFMKLFNSQMCSNVSILVNYLTIWNRSTPIAQRCRMWNNLLLLLSAVVVQSVCLLIIYVDDVLNVNVCNEITFSFDQWSNLIGGRICHRIFDFLRSILSAGILVAPSRTWPLPLRELLDVLFKHHFLKHH